MLERMKPSKLNPWVLALVGVAAAGLPLTPPMAGTANAFGGLWGAEGTSIAQPGERVIFVDNPDATITAIVQLDYAGPAQKFAWLVPVPGKTSVKISSNTIFDRLDAVTAPRYWAAVDVAGACMKEHEFDSFEQAPPHGGSADAPSSGPVFVNDRGSVGPYDYVTIALDPAASDPAAAAVAWLTSQGYDLSTLESALLGPYLQEGFSLLAFKLSKGADAGSLRPVMLTYESKLPTIPLRPAAVSAQADFALQVWVFGPTQAVPSNYKSLVLNDAMIDWSSARKFTAVALPAGGAGPFGPALPKPSNYASLVSAAAVEAGGQGFVTELAAPTSRFRSKIWGALDAEALSTLTAQTFADGIDAIYAASGAFGGWDGFREAVTEAVTLPPAVTLEAFARDPSQYRGVVTVDTARFLELLTENVTEPVRSVEALLSATPYLTRLYTRMRAPALTVDPVFDYNIELDQVSHVRVAEQFVQCSPALLRPEDAPWHMNLPQGGVVVGEGKPWPLGAGALPSNLKVVSLSTTGSGQVVQDNSPIIATTLFERAGTLGFAGTILAPPRHGLSIGGTQRLVRPRAASPAVEKRRAR